MEVTVVAPEMNPAAVDEELYEAARKAGTYKTSDELHQAIASSDVVYTDTWVDMEFFTDPAFKEEKERRIKTLSPYQLNAELLAGQDVLVMHCLCPHTVVMRFPVKSLKTRDRLCLISQRTDFIV